MGSRRNGEKLTARQVENIRAATANKASNLITRLYKCGMGEVEMNTAQVAASRALIDKVVPTVTAQDLTINQDGPQNAQEIVAQVRAQYPPELAEQLLAYHGYVAPTDGDDERLPSH